MIDPNESPDERRERIDKILERNSRPVICDVCGEKTMGRMTNIGDSLEVILACRTCVNKVYTRVVRE